MPDFSAHFQTVIPSVFRKVRGITYTRERIDTPDGDFLDLDWSKQGNPRLAVLLHGLEGNADRAYVRGMVRMLNQEGWDALALNFRSCSGEPNRLPRFYHSGETSDIRFLLNLLGEREEYEEYGLVGFSLGGNVTLKYLGEAPEQVMNKLVCAAAISVPIELAGASLMIDLPGFNKTVYAGRFLKHLNKKVASKADILPENIVNQAPAHGLRDFDDRYTAPLHGFADGADYYAKSSSLQFLPNIQIPTLLVNAKNDPFLSETCFPRKEASDNPYFNLDIPDKGGHVGFWHDGKLSGELYSEQQVKHFFATKKDLV
ncbi:MAG: YheT family hydrolase [Bacteroidia bacterium]